MVEQDSGIEIVSLGADEFGALVRVPGKTPEDIVFTFVKKTHRQQILDTAEEIMACARSIRDDPFNSGIFENNQVANTVVPIIIRDPVCMDGMVGIGNPNPAAAVTDETDPQIPWVTICGASALVVGVGLIVLHNIFVRAGRGYILAPIPDPEPPVEPMTYQTPAQRKAIYDEILSIEGIGPDQIYADPDGTIGVNDPVLGKYAMAKITDNVARYADAAGRDEIVATFSGSGFEIYDTLDDEETGVLMTYRVDGDGNPIEGTGQVVGIYDPLVRKRTLPPSTSHKP